MRKEIEVKVKVEGFDEVTNKLKELGCEISAPVEQKDTIFVDANYGEFGDFQPEKNLIRIREQGEKYILTLKQPQSNQQDSFERETEISDPKEMEEMLKLMGYSAIVKVNKVRRSANYQDITICLDEVEGLGNFIEAERIVESGNAEEIQTALLDFLSTLGVQKENQVTQGYDTLVYL